MMATFDYGTTWFADAAAGHDAVTRAAASSNSFVTLERKDHFGRVLDPITVAPLFADRVDAAVVEAVIAPSVPTVILLIPKASHYDWDAREVAEASGSTVHTFKELYTSMREPDPRPHIENNVQFVRDVLSQHSAVRAVEMICEASMLVERRDGLDDVIAAVEYEYEFGEEALVRAIKHHPDATLVVNANPNGTTTEAALAHAESADVPVYDVKTVMKALNFDGAAFRQYLSRK